MSIDVGKSMGDLPRVFDVNGFSDQLAKDLLEGKLVRYTDDRFQVSSGECKFIIKLAQEKEKYILFYAQTPYIYPLPEALRNDIKASLESLVRKPVDIEFINAGTAAQKGKLEITNAFIGD